MSTVEILKAVITADLHNGRLDAVRIAQQGLRELEELIEAINTITTRHDEIFPGFACRADPDSECEGCRVLSELSQRARAVRGIT